MFEEILSVFAFYVISALVLIFTYHQVCLTKGKNCLIILGRLVQVDGKKMNVYVTGQSGAGLFEWSTTSPFLTLRPSIQIEERLST